MLEVQRLDTRIHQRSGFCCSEPSLDLYLQRCANQHQRDGISTTHVLVDTQQPERILGYYSLAAAQLLLSELDLVDRQRLPKYPVPAIRMARLAICQPAQGQGHGEWLLGHAVQRCLALRQQLGVRALLVDALHPHAAAFYRTYGFRPSQADALTLYLPLPRP